MGTTAGALAAHSGTSSQRVSAAACNDRHSRACTEIDHTGSRTSQGHPKTTENSLSSHPESRVNCVSRFNRKAETGPVKDFLKSGPRESSLEHPLGGWEERRGGIVLQVGADSTGADLQHVAHVSRDEGGR